MLAEAESLMGRRDVKLVDLALVGTARAGKAECRVADERAALLEYDEAVAGADDARPPLGAATASHREEPGYAATHV